MYKMHIVISYFQKLVRLITDDSNENAMKTLLLAMTNNDMDTSYRELMVTSQETCPTVAQHMEPAGSHMIYINC